MFPEYLEASVQGERERECFGSGGLWRCRCCCKNLTLDAAGNGRRCRLLRFSRSCSDLSAPGVSSFDLTDSAESPGDALPLVRPLLF
ncbi:hypothetical protein ES703_114265 [subsurface metagenome]